ncbi:MAG: hypothetical protein KKC50_08105, partial [Candidatus Omnitrophica bacterium]|nr:hypothetical protein [Candidatus Omnitrophota bacterium]
AEEFGNVMMLIGGEGENAEEFASFLPQLRAAFEQRLSDMRAENEAAQTFGQVLPYATDEVKRLEEFLGIAADAADKVSQRFVTLSDRLNAFSDVIQRGISLILGQKAGALAGAGLDIATAFARNKKAQSALDDVPKGTQEFADATYAAAQTLLAFKTSVASGLMTAIESIVAMFQEGTARLSEMLSSARDAASSFARGLWDALTSTEAFANALDGISSFMSRVFDAILTPFQLIAEMFGMFAVEVKASTEAIAAEAAVRDDMMSSLNVPQSWREQRVRWAAIRPGEKPRTYEDDTADTQDQITEELTWIQQMLEQFRGLFQNHIDWFRGFNDRMKDLAEKLFPSFMKIIDGPLSTFEWALDQIATWLEDVFAKDFEAFATGFHEWWTSDVDPFLKNDVFKFLGEAFTALYNWVGGTLLPFLRDVFFPVLANDVWPAVKTALEGLGVALKDLWDTITENMPTITEFLTMFFTDIISKWTGMVETTNAFILTKSGDLMGGLKVIWDSESLSLWDKLKLSFGLGAIAIWDWFLKAIEPLKEPFANLVKALGKLWEQLAPILIPAFEILGRLIVGGLIIAIKILTAAVNIVSGVFDVIGFVIRGVANAIILVMNAIIWAWNNLIPFSKNVDYIPSLDRGGDVYRTGFAKIHAGETVMQTALARPLMAGAGGGDIYVYLGDEEVTQAVVKNVQTESGRKYGKSHTGRMFRER